MLREGCASRSPWTAAQGMHGQESQRAICRLRHEELLDAAHILPDGPMRARLLLPRNPALRPNREFLERRYGRFRRAG